MNKDITFEGMSAREKTINACLKKYDISDLQEAKNICLEKNIFPEKIVKSIQPIAFENAVWAYTVGAALYMVGKKRRYAHTAFHVFTVVGSLLHFLCILLYVI